ncbi:hypothetical protein N9K07_04235 [Arenitalea sp.]|nr:hypothetical protein [Algibacter sp.]MDA9069938.1 hypothetical protein [Algibacter sp.]
MKLTISKTHITNFLILLPFILVYLGSTLTAFDKGLSSLLKLGAFTYMLLYIIMNRKFNKNLFFFTIIFIPFLLYGILISFSLKAGIDDGVRYLFPIVTLFYSYSIKKHFKVLLYFIIAFVLLNFITQLFNYYYSLQGGIQWFYYATEDGYRYVNKTAGILRATGTVVFFGFFGFFNLIAFFVINKFYIGKYKDFLLGITLFGLLGSISFKALGAFFIVLVVYYYKKIYKIAGYLLLLVIGVYFTYPAKINLFLENLILRIQLYITTGNSARSESYRVMFNEFADFNLFGRGVGAFGGPASTKYNSPFYGEVNFNWFDAAWLNLSTTDTYLPHLFVELGIVGGILYFLVLITPLLKTKMNNKMMLVLVIYFCLFFDMLFSFSLNNLEYLFFSLIFVYPILNYNEE